MKTVSLYVVGNGKKTKFLRIYYLDDDTQVRLVDLEDLHLATFFSSADEASNKIGDISSYGNLGRGVRHFLNHASVHLTQVSFTGEQHGKKS